MKISIAPPWGMNFSDVGKNAGAAVVARKENYSVTAHLP
jgi:hypothetical protein